MEDVVSKIAAFPAFWTAAGDESAGRSGTIECKDFEGSSATAHQAVVKGAASIICKVKGTT
jgi:hypothetical protein